MRAALIESYGGPDVLSIMDRPPPSPGPGQVLVRTSASSINPADVVVRNGWMAAYVALDLPLILGTDLAGEVVDVGEGVTELSVGDLVFGTAAVMTGGTGAFAEYAATSPDTLARAPSGIDMATAGTLPLAACAALQAISTGLAVAAGDRLLIHGAAGGVGRFALAVAARARADVVATAHGPGVASLRTAGASEVVDTDRTDPATLPPFDLVLDLVCADPFLPVTVTKEGGRVVALLTPPDAEASARKGLTVELQATTVTTAALDEVRGLVEEGVLVPLVDQSFPLEDVVKAFEVKEAGGVQGKVGITVGP